MPFDHGGWTVPLSASGIRDVRLVGDTLYVAVQDGISGHTSSVTAFGPIAPAA